MRALRGLVFASLLSAAPRLGSAQAPGRLGFTFSFGGVPSPAKGFAVTGGALFVISSRVVASAELQTFEMHYDQPTFVTSPCPPPGCPIGPGTTTYYVKGADLAVLGVQLFEMDRHRGFYLTLAGGPGRLRANGGHSRLFLGYQAGFGLALPLGDGSFIIEPRYVFLGNLYPDRPYTVPVLFGLRLQH